jgi:hypothetical protein
MESLDHYCERTDPSFWAEPLNAITNLGFIVAAFILWRDARSLNRLDAGVRVLLALVFSIGVGSFLFHTFANTATLWLDILPIMAFLFAYLWLSVRRVLTWSPVAAAAAMAVFLLVFLAAGQFGHILNGALFYSPALLMLIGLTIAPRFCCTRRSCETNNVRGLPSSAQSRRFAISRSLRIRRQSQGRLSPSARR